jgi:hypothetical protein
MKKICQTLLSDSGIIGVIPGLLDSFFRLYAEDWMSFLRFYYGNKKLYTFLRRWVLSPKTHADHFEVCRMWPPKTVTIEDSHNRRQSQSKLTQLNFKTCYPIPLPRPKKFCITEHAQRMFLDISGRYFDITEVHLKHPFIADIPVLEWLDPCLVSVWSAPWCRDRTYITKFDVYNIRILS